jgi:hypothetical protein
MPPRKLQATPNVGRSQRKTLRRHFSIPNEGVGSRPSEAQFLEFRALYNTEVEQLQGFERFKKTKEYRDKLSKRTKDMWMDDSHKEKISTKMKGRKIDWADKISNSIKEWHKTNPISDESRKRSSEKVSKKMKGYEFVTIPENIQNEIKKLYFEHNLFINTFNSIIFCVGSHLIHPS